MLAHLTVIIAAGSMLLTLVYGPDLAWAANTLSWTVLALIALALLHARQMRPRTRKVPPA